MQYPLIHLNGTNGQDLLDQYSAAMETLSDAIVALRGVDVHGRDYYTINSDAASVAMKEHRARLSSLNTVLQDLEKIATNICEQITRPNMRA